MALRVSSDRFNELVTRAIESLPAEFRSVLDEISVEVRDRASASERKRVGIAGDSLLLGLYHGRPRTQRGVDDDGVMPDTITLFQSEIEQVCRDEPELIEQVRTTLLHELGHHFGMDEDDLDKVGFG